MYYNTTLLIYRVVFTKKYFIINLKNGKVVLRFWQTFGYTSENVEYFIGLGTVYCKFSCANLTDSTPYIFH